MTLQTVYTNKLKSHGHIITPTAFSDAQDKVAFIKRIAKER